MFVTSNKLSDLKQYFKTKLGKLFSDSELKFMFDEIITSRLKITKTELLLDRDLRLSESDLLYVRGVVNRLLENEPFQYIVGETEFFGLTINCDSRALIPRPETEELVRWIYDSISNKNGELQILDLCTGSGCIALGLKSKLKNTVISALDISKDALELAKENAIRNRLEINVLEVNLLATKELNFPKHSFDIWVSNPPYIPWSEKEKMQDNVLKYEPHLALFVHENQALIFYEKIIQLAQNYLKIDGQLFFEIHEDLATEVVELLQRFRFLDIEIKKDLQGKNRMVKAKK